MEICELESIIQIRPIIDLSIIFCRIEQNVIKGEMILFYRKQKLSETC